MTIAEKIQVSADKTRFTLFKEGIFYKCYNVDAMLFVKKVREYKVSSKYIKNVGAEVLSMGFPESEVSKGNLTLDMMCELLGAEKYDDEKEKITFYLKNDIKQVFESLQNGVVNENSVLYINKINENKSESNESNINELVSMIKNYDLANSTPMQSLTFIQQLKMEIHKVEKINGNI